MDVARRRARLKAEAACLLGQDIPGVHSTQACEQPPDVDAACAEEPVPVVAELARDPQVEQVGARLVRNPTGQARRRLAPQPPKSLGQGAGAPGRQIRIVLDEPGALLQPGVDRLLGRDAVTQERLVLRRAGVVAGGDTRGEVQRRMSDHDAFSSPSARR